MVTKKVRLATLALGGLLTLLVPATAMARDADDGYNRFRSDQHESREHFRRERPGDRDRRDRRDDRYDNRYGSGFQNGYRDGYNAGYQNGYYDQAGYWHPYAR